MAEGKMPELTKFMIYKALTRHIWERNTTWTYEQLVINQTAESCGKGEVLNEINYWKNFSE